MIFFWNYRLYTNFVQKFYLPRYQHYGLYVMIKMSLVWCLMSSKPSYLLHKRRWFCYNINTFSVIKIDKLIELEKKKKNCTYFIISRYRVEILFVFLNFFRYQCIFILAWLTTGRNAHGAWRVEIKFTKSI